MSTCPTPTLLGHLPHRLDQFGQVLATPNPRLRLRFEEAGGTGEGAGGEGGEGEGEGESALGDAGQQAIDRMKAERNTARAEAKAFKELGLTPDEIKAVLDEKNKGQAPDETKIREKAQKDADEAAATKYHGMLRSSSVREQAASLGFSDPKDALAMLSKSDLEDVDVTDDAVDEKAIKKLLDDLAKAKPYLLKPTDTTADHTAAGIGATGSGTPPEVQPGLARITAAYENSSKKK